MSKSCANAEDKLLNERRCQPEKICFSDYRFMWKIVVYAIA